MRTSSLLGILALALLVIPCALAHSFASTDLQLFVVPDTDLYADTPTGMYLFFLNETSGSVAKGFEVSHERELLVFILSDDFRSFAHLHPEDSGGMNRSSQGYYWVNYTFPTGGRYHVVAGASLGGQSIIKGFPVYVRGESNQTLAAPDPRNERQFGNYTVTLRAPTLHAGELSEFSYYIKENGVPVTDLEQYLGTEMHIVIADFSFAYIDHLHPYVPGHGIHSGTMAQRYAGPAIPMRYNFTAPGKYVMFGQFKHHGEVITTDFLINVEPPVPAPVQDPVKKTRIWLFMAAGALCVLLLYFWRRRK